ncbi:MAG: hypothetical protein UV36_C0025G0006 [Parcubacteria group bacterium GW2011_GWC2_42_6]|nr:MAG: hypothetical protein UU87_C0004G0043 [Parcubacteria group bacterium GW2011_GWA2_42_11]KKS66437.1 MAG: hypothetical protein UV36_C0025G0006 [Parcubacteria group bacterium GW2011_GWC2_42_6]
MPCPGILYYGFGNCPFKGRCHFRKKANLIPKSQTGLNYLLIRSLAIDQVGGRDESFRHYQQQLDFGEIGLWRHVKEKYNF